MVLFAIAVLLLTTTVAGAANLAETEKLLTKIKSVSKEGAGNQEAQAAWKDLVAQGGDALFPTLIALDDATPVAANWLRSAVNAIAEKAGSKSFPAAKLEEFVKDMKHSPAGRRIAYEILADADPKTPERLLPGMLNDPSNEIGRDSVAAALTTS